MKSLKILLPVFLGLILLVPSKAQYNVITYNIRLNTAGDGENAWPYRKENVVQLLAFHEADIFCLQEALDEQVQYINAAFPDYNFEGVGRDDGKRKGEYSPIFYNTKRFKKVKADHFWLAENPALPALGWDAACIRICTWIALEDIATGQQFYVFNTHFDHVGVEARKQAARLIVDQIKSHAHGQPVILCGDFNLPPDSEPLRYIAAHLGDARLLTEKPPYGPEGTFSGFTYDDEPGDRIDYIFVTEQWNVNRYGVLTDSKDRKFFSDHLPVLAEVEVKPQE